MDVKPLQENSTTASITDDYALIESILQDKCLHCAYARVLFPEIKDLSDEEIMEKHKDKRQLSKAPRFAYSYGGSAYTVANNLNISLELASTYYTAYKELHSGIFNWADSKVDEFIEEGSIIQPVTNFRLRLPFIEQFKELKEVIEKFSRDDWDLYKQGKTKWKSYLKDVENKVENIEKPSGKEVDFYLKYKDKMSRYFSLKSSYYRLTLNNPSQGLAAHQTKLATYYMFEYIKQNNDLWKARICNQIHDEICMEVVEELTDKYAKKLGEFMVDAGNKLLPNKIIKMKADAGVGDSWYSAKG